MLYIQDKEWTIGKRIVETILPKERYHAEGWEDELFVYTLIPMLPDGVKFFPEGKVFDGVRTGPYINGSPKHAMDKTKYTYACYNKSIRQTESLNFYIQVHPEIKKIA